MNNAGIPLVGNVEETSEEDFERLMRVNVSGVFHGCKHAIPHMMEAGGGSIVSTSSNQGLAGDLTQGAYACAKAAVIQLMRSVATQYGRYGIRARFER